MHACKQASERRGIWYRNEQAHRPALHTWGWKRMSLLARTVAWMGTERRSIRRADPLIRSQCAGIAVCMAANARACASFGCRTLQDDDPYVRKTAAVCVAKLYDINPELVEDRGFLDMLKVWCPPALPPP